jgi:hypothetical protein
MQIFLKVAVIHGMELQNFRMCARTQYNFCTGSLHLCTCLYTHVYARFLLLLTTSTPIMRLRSGSLVGGMALTSKLYNSGLHVALP